MPIIGPLIFTMTSPESPGLMVAELAAAVTPQAQLAGSIGASVISPTWSAALPVFVKAK